MQRRTGRAGELSMGYGELEQTEDILSESRPGL